MMDCYYTVCFVATVQSNLILLDSVPPKMYLPFVNVEVKCTMKRRHRVIIKVSIFY